MNDYSEKKIWRIVARVDDEIIIKESMRKNVLSVPQEMQWFKNCALLLISTMNMVGGKEGSSSKSILC